MRIGVPREIKDNEFRVGLVPTTVADLIARGHTVSIEAGAGLGAGISDCEYAAVGAKIRPSAADIFHDSELIIKVKEPLAAERRMLGHGQTVFTYLHLAPDRELTHDLLQSRVTAIGYETVTDAEGGLPLLKPMSEIAGRMAAQVGAHFLERPNGGRGVLLGGPVGVPPSRVIVIGAGSVGKSAALIAAGMQAKVTVVARNLESLRAISEMGDGCISTTMSTSEAIDALCRDAELVITSALIPGAMAPILVSRATVSAMKPGAVIVDVSIDQGGNVETSRPTTHTSPTFVLDGVLHYCVANMPGAVPRTSTLALNAATRPFVLALADKGIRRALNEDRHLRDGLGVHDGKIACRAVADAQGLPFTAIDAL